MHVQQANYQAAVWRCSLHATPEVPNPIDHGWIEDDSKLANHWMRSPPAPDVVLQLLAYKCTRSCKLPSCTCLANGLSCTDMCKLQTCSNQKSDDEPNYTFEIGKSDDERDEHDE